MSHTTEARLPAGTRIGHVHLQVADLDRSLAFYQGELGLRLLAREGGVAFLGTEDGRPALLALAERPGARPRPAGTTGLYHFALLLPDRRELARALYRLLARSWRLQGLSDHGVSEAVYLADPDGHGIELYADRPRDRWPYRGGRLHMTTRPLDLEGLLAELKADQAPWAGLPSGTTVGHIHLQVADLRRAEAFYHGILGFDVTVRDYPGALFLSAGGYHHHLGLNIWAGEGAPPPPEGAARLVHFEVVVPGAGALEAVLARARAEGLRPEPVESGWLLQDPDGHGVLLTGY